MNTFDQFLASGHSALSEKIQVVLSIACNTSYVVLPFSQMLFKNDILRENTLVSYSSDSFDENFLFVPEKIKPKSFDLKDRVVFFIVDDVFIIDNEENTCQKNDLIILYNELSQYHKIKIALIEKRNRKSTKITISQCDIKIPDKFLQGFYNISLEPDGFNPSEYYEFHYEYGFATSCKFKVNDRTLIKNCNYDFGRICHRNGSSYEIVDSPNGRITKVLLENDKFHDDDYYPAITTISTDGTFLQIKHCKNGNLTDPYGDEPAFQMNHPDNAIYAYAFVTDGMLYNPCGDAFVSYDEDGLIEFKAIRTDDESYLIDNGIRLDGKFTIISTILRFTISIDDDVFFVAQF